MEPFTDVILGKLAVVMKIISQQQLDAILNNPPPQKDMPQSVGKILLERKLVTQEQMKAIVTQAKEEQTRHDLRFTRVATTLGFLGKDDLDRAKKIQDALLFPKPLRLVLIDEEMLTAAQAQQIIDSLKMTKMLFCPQCKKKYSMTPYHPGKNYTCPDCQVHLEVPEEEKSQQPPAMGELAPTRELPYPLHMIQQGPSGKELMLSGAAIGLDIQFPEETVDEMCGKKESGYHIQQRLGSGAMGVVYIAEQIKLRRQVALKMLSQKFSEDNRYIKRFMGEIRAAAKLNHPNILQVYDAGQIEGNFFFSMELLKGDSIENIITRMKKIPCDNALDIVIDITKALIELYEHEIVHRDIKPDNIMITTKGVAKLADLGLAKNSDSDDDSKMVMGTPCYIAPEQITAPQTVDHRADIYSLGASMYRMVTGIIPFQHPDMRIVLRNAVKKKLTPACQVVSAIPSTISWIIDKMMEKNPDDRFQTPEELLTSLQDIKNADKQTPQIVTPVKPRLAAESSTKVRITSSIETSGLDFDESESGAASAPTSTPEPVDVPIVPEVLKEPAIERPLTTRRVVQDDPGTSSNTTLLAIAAAILVVILALVFFPRDDKPKVIKKEPTEAELRAQEHQQLTPYLQQCLRDKNAKVWRIALDKINDFYKKHRGSDEARSLIKYEKRLQQQIAFAEEQRKFQKWHNRLQQLLKKNFFVEAKKAAQIDLAFPELQQQAAKLQQQIDTQAQKQRDSLLQQCEQLQQASQFQKAIALLKKFQAHQLTIHVKAFEQRIQQLQNLERKTSQLMWRVDVQRQLYPLLAKKQFARARDYLDKKGVLIDKVLQQHVEKFRREISSLEQLDAKILTILDTNLKKKDFRFTFLKEKPFVGQVILVSEKRRNIMIKKKKSRAVVSRPLERLTWGTKKKIWQAGMGTSEDVIYTLMLIPLSFGKFKLVLEDFSRLAAGERKTKFQEKMVLRLCALAKDYAHKRQPAAIEDLLQKHRSLYQNSDAWKLLTNWLAKILYQSGTKTREQNRARWFYKLVIEHFPDTFSAELAKQKFK